jgi:hypothetical protein
MNRIGLIAATIVATVLLGDVAIARDQATPRTPSRTPSASAPAKATQGAQPRAQAPPRTPCRANGQVTRRAAPRTPSRPTIVVPYYRPYRYDGTPFSLGFYYGVPYYYRDYDYWFYGYPYSQYPPSYEWREPVVAFGSVRLDIPQKQATVYVDRYFAGVVDDFDDVFDTLNLPAGPHRIEVRAPGYETLVMEIYVQPNHTIEYHGTLKPA